ncbi:MAG: hypothetical protein KIS73_08980 [Enhydrobacter sp.]|nr:hypothetical protein [Enhydrobacter sp.]
MAASAISAASSEIGLSGRTEVIATCVVATGVEPALIRIRLKFRSRLVTEAFMIAFASMDLPSHQGLYRNTPLALVGLLGSIAVLVGGVAAALQTSSTSDELFPLVITAIGAFVLTFIASVLAALRRHRWTIEADAVQVEERPLVPLTGRRRFRRVPFSEIVGFSLVQNMTEEMLTIATRDGDTFVLPAPGKGLIPVPDKAQLGAFANGLRAAMAAAGVEAPPVVEGMGFWNRPAGLALLGIAFVASLALPVIALWGLWEGASVRNRGGEAAAIMVMLPVGIGWLIRRSWQRRRSVLRAMRAATPKDRHVLH